MAASNNATPANMPARMAGERLAIRLSLMYVCRVLKFSIGISESISRTLFFTEGINVFTGTEARTSSRISVENE